MSKTALVTMPYIKTPSTRSAFFAFLLYALLSANPASASSSSLLGVWDTPYGLVRISRSDGVVIGRLSSAAKRCDLPKNAEVIHGRFSDGLFVGEIRVCWPARCAQEKPNWAFAMAALAPDNEQLNGAVGPLPGQCRDSAFNGRPFAFQRRPENRSKDMAAVAQDGQVGKPAGGEDQIMEASLEALLREGRSRLEEGEFEQARVALTRALSLEPTDPEIINMLGITHLGTKEPQIARRFFERAITLAPSMIDSHYNLACALAKSGKPTEALQALKNAIDHGFSDSAEMDADEDLLPLRAEPVLKEFEKLRQRAENNRLRRDSQVQP